ncbi:hypothetical protein LX32DRAFT_647384 [Colletotrichum zoysiae]|uniref:Secreted protein n=1 Tax=Colletotrichum zoysiae TaxID=1216348 RepID=A0AAD9H153_9PEZI|nr:hypothetical protein LX32DRAFT_647384 [Colletotrichum zoysiae]
MNLRFLFVLLTQIALCWAGISNSNRKGALQHRPVGGPERVLKGGEKIVVSWILSQGVIMRKTAIPKYSLQPVVRPRRRIRRCA